MNYASTDSLCKGDLRGDDKCKAQETDKAEWDKYVEEYTKELEDFLEDDDKNKVIIFIMEKQLH